MPVTCSIQACTRRAKSRGWCNTHYERWRAHGDPNTLKIAERGTGWINAQGYHVFQKGSRQFLTHRTVMEQMLGRPLRVGEVVHHLNHNKLDNRPENLWLTTPHGHHQFHTKYFRNATHKECAHCRRTLPRTEFYTWTPPSVNYDPHTGLCRTCMKAHAKRYYTPK